MSRTERREYLVGVLTFLVLATILVFTALANQHGGPAEDRGAMTFTAEFARADGIYVGAQVRVAGINFGKVTDAVLDGKRAKLTMVLDQPVSLPEDTAAVIETDGVFGQKHIELRPGGEEKVLTSGSRIAYTQDSVIIEDLIARIVGEAKAAHGATQAAPQATP